MLAGLNILDLTQDRRALAGRLLADLGANVQRWAVDEASAVALRPFSTGVPVEVVPKAQWAERLASQLASCDVLLHGLALAEAEALEISEPTLTERFPKLICAAITPFGQAGPKAGYAATELIALAASGHLQLSGAADAAPVRIAAPQAYSHAAADAAVGVLIALGSRDRDGRGQSVDVSAQQSTTLATLSRSLDGAVGQEPAVRAAYGVSVGPVYVRNQYALADGYAIVLPGILPPLAAFMARLVAWLVEDGYVGDWALEQNWASAGMDLATGALSAERWAEIERGIEQQLSQRSKMALMQIAVERRLLVAPILTLSDLLASDHAQARDLIRTVDGAKRLGPFARCTPDPLPLGPIAASQSADDPAPSSAGERAAPLAGLKILDLFWVVAGPGATRMLADFGATVVHVESRKRLDMVRNVPPYVDGVVEPERAACHHSTNAGKHNLSLDLSQPAARAVLDDLIRWADVVTESFAPGVAERLGFGFEHARALNPKVIYLSSCLLGQQGPWQAYAGYGNTAAAISGFHALCGHPDRPPMGCYGPYTDFLSVRINALLILSAVRHRARTGRAQHIDMAQAEAALYYLLPECQTVLDGQPAPVLQGNRDENMVPHGVLRVQGEDRWLALAVQDDAQWQALCDEFGLHSWRGYSLADRQHHESDIEARLAALCANEDGAELEQRLQACGVPAHQVLWTTDLASDSQLAYRQHFIPVSHAQFQGAVIESSRLLLSQTPAVPPRRAPAFGEDNSYVLTELLGYAPDRLASLEQEGVLQ